MSVRSYKPSDWLQETVRIDVKYEKLEHKITFIWFGMMILMCILSSPAVCVCVLQLLSDSQINMVKVVNSVSDALNAMQKENVGLKARVKADLQRAPVRGARLKGCSNGESTSCIFFSCVDLSVWYSVSPSFSVYIIHTSLATYMFDLPPAVFCPVSWSHSL